MARPPTTNIPPAHALGRPALADYPTGDTQLMPSFPHLLAIHTIFALLRSLLAPESFVARKVAILTNPRDHRDHLMPDVFVVLGAGERDPVYGVLRRQYRLWDEARVPDLVIEAAATTTVGRDRVGKKEDYAAMGVREYIQFDPTGEYLAPRLQVFLLGAEGVYEAVAPGDDGAVASAVLPYAWVRVGDYLRLRDGTTGQLVPTPEERAAAEAARADAAETELARLRAQLAQEGGTGLPREGPPSSTES